MAGLFLEGNAMEITLTNTLTKKREVFKPMVEGKINMYACGVTTYDICHIGHGMQAIIYDIMRRFFEFMGYDVTYVRNYTDVDDKIIKRASELGIDALTHSENMIRESLEDMASLGVAPATIEPKVSEHIPEIIDMVQGLIDKGAAYASEGDVYFKVAAFNEYGKLSNRDPDEMRAGARIEVNEKKADPLDFALWKGAKPGEVSWTSPWGEGRPGWHIECSAMALKHLGQNFDIHGGGKDLVFPHHENEIAQSEAHSGCKYVNYWVHNGLIKVGGQKMSKSLGNFLSIRDAVEKYYPETIRFTILSSHYSSNIDFSEQAFYNAYSRLMYFNNTLAKINGLLEAAGDFPQTIPDGIEVPKVKEAVTKALCDDFNTTVALSEIGLCFKWLNDFMAGKKPKKMKAKLFTLQQVRAELMEVLPILGLLQKAPSEALAEIQGYLIKQKSVDVAGVEDLVNQRNAAREAKDWAKADDIRDQLLEMSITIMDTQNGTEWQVQP